MQHTQRLEGLGLLAGGVAHDFNNLLTGILGNASLALELLPDAAAVKALLQDVVTAAHRAAGLARQLLAYSGKGRLVIEPLDLAVVVSEISRLLKAVLPKTVDVQLDLATGLPLMEGEVSQIQQIVMNLVLNAAEAVGDRTGVVVVRTRLEELGKGAVGMGYAPAELAPGKYLVLEVEDNGSGMDPETQARIFDPFFTTKSSGRGLGLAAVASIICRHRGAIQIRSAPDLGSTFRVLFPCAASAAVAPAPQADPSTYWTAGTVLVVDDEDSVRKVAELTLTRLGCSVLLAHDGVEAVEIFRRCAPQVSLILLDMTMPRLSGEETLRRLREIRPGIPVVLSSGYSETEAARRFELDSLAGFLQKPYSAAALAAKVMPALGAGKASVAKRP